ncbi:MAG TPA: hypothetical protein VIU02_09905, partial [Burkholderiales bacterium]
MPELSLALILSAATLLAVIVAIFIVLGVSRRQESDPRNIAQELDMKHLLMIKDVNAGLNTL